MEKIFNSQNSNKEKNSNEDFSIKNQSFKETNATSSQLKPDGIFKIREELKKIIRNSLIDIYEKLINTIDKKLQIEYSNEDQKDMTLEKKYEKLLKELCPKDEITDHNFEDFLNNKMKSLKFNKYNENKFKNNYDSLIDENSIEIREEIEPSATIREPNVFKGITDLKNKISIKREKNKTLDYNYIITNAEDEKKENRLMIEKCYKPNINMNSIDLINSDNIFQRSSSSQNKHSVLRNSSKFQIYKKFNKTKFIRRDKKLKKNLNIFSYQNSNSFEGKKNIEFTNSNKNLNSFCNKEIAKNILSIKKSNGDLEFKNNMEIFNSHENTNDIPRINKYIYKYPVGRFISKNKSYNNEEIKINSYVNKIPKFLTLKALDKLNKINTESEKKLINSNNGKVIKKLPCKLIQSTTEIDIINSRNSSSILKNTSRDKNVKKIDNIIFENRQNISSHNTLVAPTILKKKFIRTSNKIKLQGKSTISGKKNVNSEKIFKSDTTKTLQNNNKKTIKNNPFKISDLKSNERKKNCNFKNNIVNSALINEKSQKIICINFEKNIRSESNNAKVIKNNDEAKNNFVGSGKNLFARNYINTHNNSNVDNNISITVKKNTSNNNLNSNKNIYKKMKNFNNINTNNSVVLKKKITKGKK